MNLKMNENWFFTVFLAYQNIPEKRNDLQDFLNCLIGTAKTVIRKTLTSPERRRQEHSKDAILFLKYTFLQGIKNYFVRVNF